MTARLMWCAGTSGGCGKRLGELAPGARAVCVGCGKAWSVDGRGMLAPGLASGTTRAVGATVARLARRFAGGAS